MYLSRIDYILGDEQNHTGFGTAINGRIMQGEVLGSMDGENWTKLGDINNWANNGSTKNIRFTETQKVKYVKITTNLDVQKAGTYDVTYEVTDSDGNKTKLTIQVVIEDENEDPYKFKITSSKYNIKNNMILNVSQMTTVDEFKSLITVNRTIHIVNKKGEEQTGKDIVTTGMKLTVDNENVEYTIIVIGDLSGDGTRDIDDLARAKLHLIGIQLLENKYLQAFDIDGDEEITINDIALLKLSMLGLKDLD